MSGVAFPAEGTALLRGLAANNDRDWFAAHKAEVEANVLRPAQALLLDLSDHLGTKFGGTFQGKVYRIHRDLRFSKDKTPYNPYVRMSLSREGEDCQTAPAFHLSFETEQVVVGTGVWQFTPETLGRFRDPASEASLDVVICALQNEGARVSDPELTRLPKGMPDSDHYRRKGLTAWLESGYGEPPMAIEFGEITDRIETLSPLFGWLSRL